MTAVLTQPRVQVWLPTRQAHALLGWGWHNARKRLAAGEVHAHKSRPDRSGEWLISKDVATAARRGADLAEQVRICGCEQRGWSRPPCRAGRSRRRPLD